MESAETGACLWMVTDGKMFGIRIEKLEKLGKNDVRDWKSHLEPAPFDFRLDLPEARFMCPFIFDSKLFFGGGEFASGTNIHHISYVGGDTLDISDAVATGAIPQPPTQIYESYIANIEGDVYLVVLDDAVEGREAGLWVLRSGSRNWHSLSAPPTKRDSRRHSGWVVGSVLEDKLLLHFYAPPHNACVYDPQTDMWHKLDHTFSVSDYSLESLVAMSSLGDVGNCSVVLTWSVKKCPTSFVKYEIHALLVDNQNYCVRRRQCLHELCEGLQPSFDASSTEVNLVDLGNSKVCVIICGLAENIPALCIVVVELGLLQEEEEQRLEQRFLSVRVLGNQIYDMLPFTENSDPFFPSTSFVFSLSKIASLQGKNPS